MPAMVRLLAKVGPLYFRIAHDVSGSPSAIFRPETSTTSRCEKLITARMMCSMRMMVTPCSFKTLEQRQNLLDLRVGQAGHRFIGDQELRLCRHGAREFEFAHLDLGELARQPRCLVVETDLTQKIDASRLEVWGRTMTAAARRHGVEERNAQIVGDAETGKRPRQLKGAGKTAPRALMRGRAVEQMAVEIHRARLVPQRTADAVDQRALAGAVGPDESDPLARAYRQGDAFQRDKAAETLAEIVDLEETRSWRGFRRIGC